MKYGKLNKRQWNGKQQKPIFGGSSKVLCHEQVCIMFINMFLNLHYYLNFHIQSLLDPLICDNSQGVINI